MLRSVVRRIFRVALRVFFRRIMVVRAGEVPATGPVIFVLNHPNALIDPAFLLCLAPRPVSFLAKAPLFTMPVIGRLVRAFDSIPVYRRQDQGPAIDNRGTFDRARALLLRGQTIAIFPEGTSHSDPRLKPLKTGAARIALGTGLGDLKIVPAGLYYVAKGKFRSDALLVYGPPIELAEYLSGAAATDTGEPAPAAVQALTARIERALGEVTLQADKSEALDLVERVSQIFAATSGDPREPDDRFALRRRLVAGYIHLRDTDPPALQAIVARVERYEHDLAALGLPPDHYGPADFSLAGSLRYAARSAASLGLLLPLALLGTTLHLPTYLLTDLLARRLAHGETDMLATIKLLAAMLLYPLTWIGVGVAAGLAWGWGWGVLAGLVAPASGAAAMRFSERFATVGAAARGLLLFVMRRNTLARLHADRMAIRAALLELSGRVATSL